MSEIGDQDLGEDEGSGAPTFVYRYMMGSKMKLYHSKEELTRSMLLDRVGPGIDLHSIARVHVTKQLVEEARYELARRNRQKAIDAAEELIKKSSSTLAAELGRRATRAAAAILLTSLPADPLAPPKTGQFLLSLVASRETQEEVIGDLDERYPTQVARFGFKRARFWYYWQTGLIVLAFVPKKLAKIAGLVKIMSAMKS